MLVDKEWKIKVMLDTLTSRPPDGTVGIFLDLEGQNLGFRAWNNGPDQHLPLTNTTCIPRPSSSPRG